MQVRHYALQNIWFKKISVLLTSANKAQTGKLLSTLKEQLEAQKNILTEHDFIKSKMALRDAFLFIFPEENVLFDGEYGTNQLDFPFSSEQIIGQLNTSFYYISKIADKLFLMLSEDEQIQVLTNSISQKWFPNIELLNSLAQIYADMSPLIQEKWLDCITSTNPLSWKNSFGNKLSSSTLKIIFDAPPEKLSAIYASIRKNLISDEVDYEKKIFLLTLPRIFSGLSLEEQQYRIIWFVNLSNDKNISEYHRKEIITNELRAWLSDLINIKDLQKIRSILDYAWEMIEFSKLSDIKKLVKNIKNHIHETFPIEIFDEEYRKNCGLQNISFIFINGDSSQSFKKDFCIYDAHAQNLAVTFLKNEYGDAYKKKKLDSNFFGIMDLLDKSLQHQVFLHYRDQVKTLAGITNHYPDFTRLLNFAEKIILVNHLENQRSFQTLKCIFPFLDEILPCVLSFLDGTELTTKISKNLQTSEGLLSNLKKIDVVSLGSKPYLSNDEVEFVKTSATPAQQTEILNQLWSDFDLYHQKIFPEFIICWQTTLPDDWQPKALTEKFIQKINIELKNEYFYRIENYLEVMKKIGINIDSLVQDLFFFYMKQIDLKKKNAEQGVYIILKIVKFASHFLHKKLLFGDLMNKLYQEFENENSEYYNLANSLIRLIFFPEFLKIAEKNRQYFSQLECITSKQEAKQDYTDSQDEAEKQLKVQSNNLQNALKFTHNFGEKGKVKNSGKEVANELCAPNKSVFGCHYG